MMENIRKESMPLFPHQSEGIEYLKGSGDKALFDEPGLGKTRQIIEAIDFDINSGLVKGVIVICPNFVKSTWKKEVLKYSGYKPVVFGNDSTGRRQAYLHLKISYYIINYEAIITEKENLKRLMKFRPMALILDESQRIKNPDAKVTKAVLELRDLAAKRIIMTGTPVANHPEDLWSQFLFLDGGELLGDSFYSFKSLYGERDHTDNLAALQEMLSNNSLRRRKIDVLNLPTKHFIDHSVEMNTEQAEMYSKLREDLSIWVKNMEGKDILKNAENILARMLRLAQIASNPRLVDSSYNNEVPAKFSALDDIVTKHLEDSSDNKLIIWSSFVQNVIELAERYKKYGTVMIHGSVPDEIRENNLDHFHNDRNIRVLVANPAAAREGLTLTEANAAIYVDRTFNLVDYLQSQDRIHRISQTKECYIINLVANGTIDEFISYLLSSKQQIAEYVQSDDNTLIPDIEITRAELLKALL